jgi:tRNA-Thr(GGU) m(6)t(6)A37 methyltransferase TsaA
MTSQGNTFMFDAVGIVHSPFKEKFGIPRQPGLTNIPAVIELLPPYNVADVVKGLDAFSHIWISFVFHAIERDWKPLVRPPRLGGNEKLGVFATRSTHRPNPIGLSVVKLEKIDIVDGVKLHVRGADLLDGTPVLDIKPYVPYVDSIDDARAGFALEPPQRLRVMWQPQALQQVEKISSELRALIEDVLGYDPRPAYQDEPERVYGMLLGGANVRFRIRGNAIEIVDVSG